MPYSEITKGWPEQKLKITSPVCPIVYVGFSKKKNYERKAYHPEAKLIAPKVAEKMGIPKVTWKSFCENHGYPYKPTPQPSVKSLWKEVCKFPNVACVTPPDRLHAHIGPKKKRPKSIPQTAKGRALKRFGMRCFYCVKPLDHQTLTMDHFVPVSRGGKNMGNLVPSCQPCNNAKRDRMPTDAEWILFESWPK